MVRRSSQGGRPLVRRCERGEGINNDVATYSLFPTACETVIVRTKNYSEFNLTSPAAMSFPRVRQSTASPVSGIIHQPVLIMQKLDKATIIRTKPQNGNWMGLIVRCCRGMELLTCAHPAMQAASGYSHGFNKFHKQEINILYDILQTFNNVSNLPHILHYFKMDVFTFYLCVHNKIIILRRGIEKICFSFVIIDKKIN